MKHWPLWPSRMRQYGSGWTRRYGPSWIWRHYCNERNLGGLSRWRALWRTLWFAFRLAILDARRWWWLHILRHPPRPLTPGSGSPHILDNLGVQINLEDITDAKERTT